MMPKTGSELGEWLEIGKPCDSPSRFVVELPSGAVSVNPRSNKVTNKRPILRMRRL